MDGEKLQREAQIHLLRADIKLPTAGSERRPRLTLQIVTGILLSLPEVPYPAQCTVLVFNAAVCSSFMRTRKSSSCEMFHFFYFF